MGEITIGDALRNFMESTGWKQRMFEIRIKKEWAEIVGKTVAKYTGDLYLHNGILTIVATVAPLKQELLYAKSNLRKMINDYFKEIVVQEIVIK